MDKLVRLLETMKMMRKKKRTYVWVVVENKAKDSVDVVLVGGAVGKTEDVEVGKTEMDVVFRLDLELEIVEILHWHLVPSLQGSLRQ